MTIRWALAVLHLLALGIGLGAVWARGRALKRQLTPDQLRQVFSADAWWGLSALLWIGTGMIRAFGGLEKGTAYYLHNHLFLTKMGLLALIIVLEVGPMIALVRWRVSLKRGQPVDVQRAPRYARISFLQAAIVVLMVVLATGMARGYGSGAP